MKRPTLARFAFVTGAAALALSLAAVAHVAAQTYLLRRPLAGLSAGPSALADTPDVSCGASQALTWDGADWGCIAISGGGGGATVTLCTNENSDNDSIDDKPSCVEAARNNATGGLQTTTSRAFTCLYGSGNHTGGGAMYFGGGTWHWHVNGTWYDCADGTTLVVDVPG